MSSAETQAEKAGKGKRGAQPLSQKERLELDTFNFEAKFQNAIENAKVMAEDGMGTFKECLWQSLQHDADLRDTIKNNIYPAKLAVPRLTQGYDIIRRFILEAEQSQPLPRRGKNPRWDKLKPRRDRAN